jgi:hypothetical protein
MKQYNMNSCKLLSTLALVALLVGSCSTNNKPTQNKNASDSTNSGLSPTDTTTRTVIKQRFSNGIIKAEIAVLGNKRDGLTRFYNEDGTLKSEVTYVNNEKNGIARDFYPNKKIRMEIMYVHGIMEGEAKWHYETGEVYRVTPYVKGKADGVQKEYYKDGRIKAELPHKSGNPMPGLKEYNLKGELIPQPSIVIVEQDKIAMEGKFILKMHLSDHATNVKWYEGDLRDWSFFPKALAYVKDDPDGSGTIIYSVDRGNVVMKTIYIYAVTTTAMGNELVLKKNYDLAYKGL